jgi:hypothetical protein
MRRPQRRELRALRMPVLLLMGNREVIRDPVEALARARRVIPQFERAIVPDCSHDNVLQSASARGCESA